MIVHHGKGVAGVLILTNAHQVKTTETDNDSRQLCPFSKMGTSLKGKNLLPGSEFFSLRAGPYDMETLFPILGDISCMTTYLYT